MGLICLIKGHQYDNYKCVRCGRRREFLFFHKLMDKDDRKYLAKLLIDDQWNGYPELAEAIQQDECTITPEQFAVMMTITEKYPTGPRYIKENDLHIRLYRIWLRWLSDTYMEYQEESC